KAEAERLAAEKAEAERLDAESLEAERLAAETLAAEKAEADKKETDCACADLGAEAEADTEPLQLPKQMSGIMTKIGHKSGKWQRRHFELVPSSHRLVYAKKAGGKAKGHVQLGQGSRVEGVQAGAEVERAALKNKAIVHGTVMPHTFLVSDCDTQRVYYMTCATAYEQKLWIASIRALL
ncbi:hypothetical protein KIPB_013750, partial [Kipferlia bialata]